MGVMKKLGEKTKDAASAIGSKTSEAVEKHSLNVEKGKHEKEIKEKKDSIGEYVYSAYSNGEEPDKAKLLTMVDEIKKIEVQIMEIDEKLKEK
ncbi:hypothetical protein SAMN02745945_01920 [Peptoclostridium litorale DSM 5388]|uniref:Uncharacterized protein n=1 Tax=Peptoclostridium litorale DSM 5388 TaxID=1121324 RepID=A0A069RJ84_PEPLI|nr:hypothetical protein [Peptoclostridium litorale]KDR96190.1 hypothetical protein CLIT_4c00270 [Peptoclostridium litorale DSM 5388]SIO13249.1 hypothetical protein SAMN02745945_01920 [Peptoclostridium litorale DSM 5388]